MEIRSKSVNYYYPYLIAVLYLIIKYGIIEHLNNVKLNQLYMC